MLDEEELDMLTEEWQALWTFCQGNKALIDNSDVGNDIIKIMAKTEIAYHLGMLMGVTRTLEPTLENNDRTFTESVEDFATIRIELTRNLAEINNKILMAQFA